MATRTQHAIRLFVGSCFITLGAACGDVGPSEPPAGLEPLASSRAGLACWDVAASGAAPLGIIPAGYEGAGSIGGMPGPALFGGQLGELHSYVTSPIAPVGSKHQGAAHLTLVHVFTAAGGTFHTADRAVCGPLPDGPGTCRLSDQLTITEGTGVFADAAGKLHNRGVLDFNAFVLTFDLKGTVCGAGL